MGALLSHPLLQGDGPMIRLRDLASITGLSKRTLQLDAASGHLKALRRHRGRTTLLLVSRPEARRYVAVMFRSEQIA